MQLQRIQHYYRTAQQLKGRPESSFFEKDWILYLLFFLFAAMLSLHTSDVPRWRTESGQLYNFTPSLGSVSDPAHSYGVSVRTFNLHPTTKSPQLSIIFIDAKSTALKRVFKCLRLCCCLLLSELARVNQEVQPSHTLAINALTVSDLFSYSHNFPHKSRKSCSGRQKRCFFAS